MNAICRRCSSIILFLGLTSLGACVLRPWRPTNVGRENGAEKTPLFVSHLPEKNKWVLARTKSHNIFQQVLCFDYVCRRMVGRKKALGSISFKQFRKEITKNAKKGVYQHMTPVTAPALKKKSDSVIVKKAPLRATPAKAVPASARTILKQDSIITLNDFLFETNSFKLKDEHYAQLDSLGKFLLSHPTLEVHVAGHTDNIGNERHNITLSARRAEVVAKYLTNFGVADDKVFFDGFGSAKPITGNDTEEGRRKNRRVEVLLRDPNQK